MKVTVTVEDIFIDESGSDTSTFKAYKLYIHSSKREGSNKSDSIHSSQLFYKPRTVLT
jgi:hypothetical protein